MNISSHSHRLSFFILAASRLNGKEIRSITQTRLSRKIVFAFLRVQTHRTIVELDALLEGMRLAMNNAISEAQYRLFLFSNRIEDVDLEDFCRHDGETTTTPLDVFKRGRCDC